MKLNFFCACYFCPLRPSTRHHGRYSGLKNLGHTCYINSCIQALLFTPQFLESLQSSWKHLSELAPVLLKSHSSPHNHSVNFLRVFVGLLAKMRSYGEQSSDLGRLAPDPYQFIHSCSLINMQYGPLSDQQDVQEFFVFLLSTLDDLILTTKKLIEENAATSNLSSTEATYFFIPKKDLLTSISKAASSQDQSSIAESNVNAKKRPLSSSTADSDLPISSTPRFEPKDAPLDILNLNYDAKRPKRAEFESSWTHSLTISEASTHSVDRTILPESQDIAREFELTYESPSQDLLLQTESNPSSMDVDVSLPSVSELPPLPKASSILDFMPTSDSTSTESKANLFPHQLFQGEIRSTFQCIECERESGPSPEGFFDISLAIEEQKDLNWSLNKFFSKSILRGDEKYDCSECKLLNEAYHYTRLNKLPKILTVHLKRFSWNSPNYDAPYSGFARRMPAAGSKLTFHVSCPAELSIARGWLSHSLLQSMFPTVPASSVSAPLSESISQGMLSSDTLSESITTSRSMSKSVLQRIAEEPAAQYELYAIIYHVGSSTTSGHYTCSVRLPHSQKDSVLSEPSWAHFDDQNVSILTHSRVMYTISEHPAGGATAYILLYRLLE